MLKEIIAKYLQISEQQAQALLDLLTLEKRWQETQPLGNRIVNPTNIHTQLELIEFMQGLGQSKWFKGHDRSKFPPDMQEDTIKEIYWNLFKNFGMTEALTSNVIPDYSVVLGSSELHVTYRTESMIQDLIRGITPKSQTILGCGAGRELGKSVIVSEQNSIDTLTKQGLVPNEMNMVSLIVQQQLAQHGFHQSFKYVPVDAGGAIDRTKTDFATTEHNAKGILETIQGLTHNQSQGLIIVTIYSNQPFVERQARDIEVKFRDDQRGVSYQVNRVGQACNKEEFMANTKSIGFCLGEIARLINIMYKRLNSLEANIPLTREEREELQDLINKADQTVFIPEPTAMMTREIFQPVLTPLNTTAPVKTNEAALATKEKLTATYT